MKDNFNKDKNWDYNEIMSDRDLFNKTVYTPLSEAMKELEIRKDDKELLKKIDKLFKGKIPEVLNNNEKCSVFARQIATPNNESRLFLSISKEYNLRPIFFEYLDDKFVTKNKYKHSLGQLNILKKINKNGNYCLEKVNIIDFNKNSGKKLREIKTIKNIDLVNFHHGLFKLYNIDNVNFHDESSWYKKNNIKDAKEAYMYFLLLFVCFGILFENFLISKDSEGEFTKNVVLPSLKKVIDLTGLKPLIVPIDAIDLESDDFDYYHSELVKDAI